MGRIDARPTSGRIIRIKGFELVGLRLGHSPYTRRAISPEGIALLSCGLALAYLLGLSNYRLHERGWPAWVPSWFPGPVAVLQGLPGLGMSTCLAALALFRLRERRAGRGPGRFPKVCRVALAVNAPGLVLTIALAPRWLPLWLRKPADPSNATLCCILVVGSLPALYLWARYLTIPTPGHCQRCGYDLTGNVSGTCPECGTGIPDNSR